LEFVVEKVPNTCGTLKVLLELPIAVAILVGKFQGVCELLKPGISYLPLALNVWVEVIA
jgi:hypothetical protein